MTDMHDIWKRMGQEKGDNNISFVSGDDTRFFFFFYKDSWYITPVISDRILVKLGKSICLKFGQEKGTLAWVKV